MVSSEDKENKIQGNCRNAKNKEKKGIKDILGKKPTRKNTTVGGSSPRKITGASMKG